MRKARLRVNVFYILADIVLITLSTYISYILRYNRLSPFQFFSLPVIWGNLSLPALSAYSLIFLFWCVIAILFLNNYKLYETDRELSVPSEIYMVFKSIFFSSLPTIAAVFLLKIDIFSRQVFGYAALLMFVSLTLWRTMKRLWVRRLVSRGYNNLNVLIIGAGKMGKLLISEIRKRPYLGLRIMGYLDDFKEKHEPIEGYEVLGKTSDFETVVRQRFIDEALISIPSYRKLVSDLVMKGRNLGVSVRIIPDQFDLIAGEIKMHHIGFMPLLEYHSKGIHGTNLFMKRAMDICLSGLGLLLLSPLFLLLAIAVKLNSKGGIFYRSKRCGKKGRVFNFYKFRSMVKDADTMLPGLRHKNEMDGPIFKMKKDPRETRIGRFIRRFSLDELPQLGNVLKGDMSLVGPRPPTPEEVEKYEDWQLRKLEIRPGITCLWQVRGRSDLSFHQWMKWDIWYIDNWSFWLDLRILLWTVPVVLKRKGAY